MAAENDHETENRTRRPSDKAEAEAPKLYLYRGGTQT